ncbi:MAG TPA: type IV-A pilus assembly ATPase PilB [Desulfobacterales bacterium]|nr:type IV-A pilus assembly ATPase PilB [Desulfobacterales bacterium]
MANTIPIKKTNPNNGVQSRRSSLKSTIMDQSGAGKTKIGELLCKEGYITGTHLEDAISYQKKNNGRLGNILVKLGYIDDETIVNVLSRVHNYPTVNISKTTPDPEVFKIMPYETAKKYMAFPLRFKGEALVVTMAEPTDTGALDGLQNEVKKSLSVCVSTEKDIVDGFKAHYEISDEEYKSYFGIQDDVGEEEPVSTVDDFGSLVSEAVVDMEVIGDHDEKGLVDEYTASDAPIIKLVNGILVKAINEGVSDIHIEPFEKMLQVRYRLDGYLFKSMNLPTSIKNAVNSRLKILAGLNIAERRVPQDGRIKMAFGKRKAIDFRVSTLPTLFGESIVMRVLDQSTLRVDLSQMGFEKETLNGLERSVYRPYGLLLVTGPTGSGKTTTLYSILNKLNKEDCKILTVEDPVEFNFKGINQVSVKTDVGMTFAAALRSFLRQDPDIIMVGEIRDQETAEIALKASMTGHLVFSTLHTNDCPSTIGRLVDIGIPSYLLASAVTMVLSQRLVRRLCQNCKAIEKNINPTELVDMGFSPDEISKLQIYGPKGCPECMGSGYKGRVGLFELMEITENVARVISADVSEDILRKTALHEGMVTLRNAGLEKIRQGATSVEEVLRRTNLTKGSIPEYLATPEIEEYDSKAVIFREGNRGSDFFKLVKGELIVVKDGKKISEIVQPGDYFGEIAAITGKERSETVISRGKSIVERYPGDKFHELIDKYPKITNKILEQMAGRIDASTKVLVNLMNHKPQ